MDISFDWNHTSSSLFFRIRCMLMNGLRIIIILNIFKRFLFRMSFETWKCTRCIFIIRFLRIKSFSCMSRTVCISRMNTWLVWIETILNTMIRTRICQLRGRIIWSSKRNWRSRALRFIFIIKFFKCTLMRQCIIINRSWMEFSDLSNMIMTLLYLRQKMLLFRRCREMQNSSRLKFFIKDHCRIFKILLCKLHN